MSMGSLSVKRSLRYSPTHPAEITAHKVEVERNLLYHYLSDFEAHPCKGSDKEHLNLLVEHMKKDYAVTSDRLASLLKAKEISYDLLWALFKPGTVVYTTCIGTLKPRCVIFDYGEEKTTKNDTKYYSMACRYLDFDGDILGEVTGELAILKFPGTKRISCLEAFPIDYHSTGNTAKAELVECGRKFVSLMGTRHRHCVGAAYTLDSQGNIVRLSVDSRIMVDAAFFRKINPNYSRPRVIKAEATDKFDDIFGNRPRATPDQVKNANIEPMEMTEREFLICSPVVPGFNFEDKTWGERSLPKVLGPD